MPGVAHSVHLRIDADGGFYGDFLANGLALPVASRSLSAIESTFALEAVEAPFSLLVELARCLRPEGLLRIVGVSRVGAVALRHPDVRRRAVGAAKVVAHVRDNGLTVLSVQRPGGLLGRSAWVMLAQRRMPGASRLSQRRHERGRPLTVGLPVARSRADNP